MWKRKKGRERKKEEKDTEGTDGGIRLDDGKTEPEIPSVRKEEPLQRLKLPTIQQKCQTTAKDGQVE